MIIDHFTGRLIGTAGPFAGWAGKVRTLMPEVLAMLDADHEQSAEQAKRRLNELVTEHLTAVATGSAALMLPIELHTDQVASNGAGRTRLRIVAQDTPAFLYSLSTALSLMGLSILRVRIQTDHDRVQDEIHVIDAHGQPIADAASLQQLKLTVLFTKQFTHFLNSSPDPFTALARFEQLTEQILCLPEHGRWLDQLGQPQTMQQLAKLLGTSDYLWEDFIRAHYEALLPILRPDPSVRRIYPPIETLPLRLQQALEPAADIGQQQDRLNAFKDQELFRIDLDHILSPRSDFRQLSDRLAMLAENLIATAAWLVHDQLVGRYGAPCDPQGQLARYAMFGLGKLCGVALGYASDIKLLLLYSSGGRTSGPEPINNATFYEHLTRQTAGLIRTKREGIFQVDLRLRPYGRDGPLACSLEQFRTYYGPQEPHPFETLALVRLRWIAGEPSLGFQVEQLRDKLVYDRPQLDLDALWVLWATQRKQKAGRQQINAKYAPGGLVDLETTVQLLQVRHASGAPQLRTPRLSAAMEALHRATVLSAEEFSDLAGAYDFLRRLINALRMLRGNAQDLFLPPEQSAVLVPLTRRMGHPDRRGAGRQLLDELARHTRCVQDFVQRRFGRPCPA